MEIMTLDLSSSERWLWEGGTRPSSFWGPWGCGEGPDAVAGRLSTQCEESCPRALSESHWLCCHQPVQSHAVVLPQCRWLLPGRQGKQYTEWVQNAQLWMKKLYGCIPNPDIKFGNVISALILDKNTELQMELIILPSCVFGHLVLSSESIFNNNYYIIFNINKYKQQQQ